MLILAHSLPCIWIAQEAEYCQQEMSRAVRLALWDYKVGAPLTTVCDADVQDKCPVVRLG